MASYSTCIPVARCCDGLELFEQDLEKLILIPVL